MAVIQDEVGGLVEPTEVPLGGGFREGVSRHVARCCVGTLILGCGTYHDISSVIGHHGYHLCGFEGGQEGQVSGNAGAANAVRAVILRQRTVKQRVQARGGCH